MKRKKSNKIAGWGIMFFFLFLSCVDKDKLPMHDATKFTEYKVAIVLPRSSQAEKKRWERTAQWLQQNIEEAQQGLETGVRLNIEWYDENVESIPDLGAKLAQRDDIIAIIGPKSVHNLDLIAGDCYRTQKPLIAISVSSEDVIRRYSGQNFLWALTETDITQCEILLYRAQAQGIKSVSLLAPDNAYGKTFYDWFAFQATELGLIPKLAVSYTEETRDSYIKQLLESDVDCVICTPSSMKDMRAILEVQHAKGEDSCPFVMFSDAAMSPELLQMGEIASNAIGVAMYADPSSGFSIAYNIYFEEYPTGSEAQLYDALMLTAFAVADCKTKGTVNNVEMNASLKRITVNETSSLETLVWNGVSMQNQFRKIAEKETLYNISGASGTLDFDKKVFTNVLETVYCQWYVGNGQFLPVGYYSSKGNHRVESTLASWNWKKTVEEYLEDKFIGISYPPMNAQWALLVATSEGWTDYRHQADVLNMYQLLRKNGLDDDHIILVMADDIANNSRNPVPGTVKVTIDGENLYRDVRLDYCIDTLKPADISNILNGERSSHLPRVIESKANDNVLVFWSGHGIYEQFCWLNDRQEFSKKGFTTDMFRQTLQQMSNNKRYRKMLWLVETCHAESVTRASNGFPGVLTIAAAQTNETSKADVWSRDLKVYLSNTFTKELSEAISEDPGITFRDLYYKLNRNTTASHVKIDNIANFDNLFRSSIEEFILVAPY